MVTSDSKYALPPRVAAAFSRTPLGLTTVEVVLLAAVLTARNTPSLTCALGLSRIPYRGEISGDGRLSERQADCTRGLVRTDGLGVATSGRLPIIGRWEPFPWDEVVDTSLAFGIGPSYASSKPKVEVANDGDSRRLLVYWMMEIEVGVPDKSWSAIFRLHHRSGAFGLVADEGGSNAMVIGLKQRF